MLRKDCLSFSSYLTIALLGIFTGCKPQPVEPLTSIGENGNVDHIRIVDSSNAILRFAATELQHYVQQITGINIPITNTNANRAITLELSDDTAIRWDGYRIQQTEKGLNISANEPRGLLYAVYDLLEMSGCAFVYPGKQEQIIPEKSQIVWRIEDTIINPVLEHRGLAPYGLDAEGLEDGRDFIDWMAKNRFNYILVSEDRPSESDGSANGSVWKEVQKELLPELQKRGFVIEMSEHCTPVFFPRTLFKKHPDWFALNKGERKLGPPPYSGQMCYSNKEAVEYYGDTLARYAAIHPEFKTIGTWPLDGGEYCECENCKSSQTVFNAVLRVAEKIKKVRPDMMVEHLAYKEQTWQPPAIDSIPANISVLWCRDAGESEELVKEWKKKINPSAGIYQFEYYLGDNYRTRTNVWLRPEYSVEMLKHARATGYRGVISLVLPIQNWWRSAFNNRFYAQASWNNEFDPKIELEKYFKVYYGAQANEAKNIFSMISDDLQREPYSRESDALAANWSRVEKYSPQILRELEAVMSQSRDSVIRERFSRIKTYVEFFVLHTKAYYTRKKTDLETLQKYSKDHPEHSMVLMYPGYIHWRNEEYF